MVVTIISSNGQQHELDGVTQVVNCKHSVTFQMENGQYETMFQNDLEECIVE